MALDPSLEALLGVWVGEERLAESPWAPAGVATTTFEFTAEAGGGAVLQSYRQERDGQETLTGLGVLDIHDGRVRHFWWDSLGHPPAEPAVGERGDAVLVERTSPRGKNRTRMAREGEELVYEVAFAAPGEELAVLASGRYRRLGPGAQRAGAGPVR